MVNVKSILFLIAVSHLLNPISGTAQTNQNVKIGVFDSDSVSESEIDSTTSKKKKNQDPTDQAKVISLRDALESGLRRNYLQKIRNFTLAKLELDWKDDFYEFWLPTIQLTLNSDAHLVEKLYTDNSQGFGTSKTPNGSFGLEFSDYTLFNWGRDYLAYLNNQTTYQREKQALGEKRRRLRFEIIDQYFNVTRLKQILRARKDQLRHTSFVYRLAKEKLQLKKLKSQEYLQTKEEFLKAQSAFHTTTTEVQSAEQKLALLMGDDPGTSYRPMELLKYFPLTPSKAEAIQFANQQSPRYRQAKADLDNANRNFKLTLKQNIPLPKFSLNLGAYRHTFSELGVQDTFSTSNGSRNVEVRATVNMNWTLLGPGGLFNARTQESSYADKRIAEIHMQEAKRDINVTVRTLYSNIRSLERKYEVTQARLKNAQIVFDKALDNYIGGKTSFPNIKLIIDALMDAEIDFQNAKYLHLNYKLDLADWMGLYDFPGENFERLVIE